ncbi:NAD-dependent dihydropyrimidine dehydrogenase PreA subunit [Desulfosalsimonas propionicica]|uniref:NAD-dependent dihydropyrimidine dehydrogenase PreA subunit n=1 Tax=Desulfosalsimonas propionicica TaxID=332175 RepID=A0A7W0CB44_9BACT|nr:4Fe-4S binding protein [Desulfosalsimonas propionicica]MBA2882460.1 NAD-dependent dihydropyrimidine dehydrogenase PreA subunit [Desulfosalsimonas propionicica]
MKTLRKIIEINEDLCDGCGQCVVACAEGAIAIIDGKAKVISENLCDGLGACMGECPTGALKIVEREAEEFDEEAVEKHLENLQQTGSETNETQPELACGCPSRQVQIFEDSGQGARSVQGDQSPDSALSHWPVQIRLVPANAKFLKGADLLVLADCVAVAYPDLHRDLLQGKAVMMGCPKFDDIDSYTEKFADVFKQAGIRSVTTVTMEVPCCSGLPQVVRKGMEAADTQVPHKQIVISTKGKILKETAA